MKFSGEEISPRSPAIVRSLIKDARFHEIHSQE